MEDNTQIVAIIICFFFSNKIKFIPPKPSLFINGMVKIFLLLLHFKRILKCINSKGSA